MGRQKYQGEGGHDCDKIRCGFVATLLVLGVGCQGVFPFCLGVRCLSLDVLRAGLRGAISGPKQRNQKGPYRPVVYTSGLN